MTAYFKDKKQISVYSSDQLTKTIVVFSNFATYEDSKWGFVKIIENIVKPFTIL